MSIEIDVYRPIYHKGVVTLITKIQQDEYGIRITYKDQPDLADISGFYDVFWVALSSEKPIGTIGLKIIRDFAIIRKMFVAKEFRGRAIGVAQKLLTALEDEVTSRCVNKIYLGTTESFKAAHRFYEKNGYAEIPKADLPPDFPIMPVDTKFYLKNISTVPQP